MGGKPTWSGWTYSGLSPYDIFLGVACIGEEVQNDGLDSNCDCGGGYVDTLQCDNCFIATAAYGTCMARDVQSLRAFRDEYLMTNALGTAFVDAYYRYSPPAADFIRNKPALKAVVRFLLKPAIRIAEQLIR